MNVTMISLLTMKELSKWETAVFLVGGLLMVIGSGAYILLQTWAAYLFCLGALMFVAMQIRQRYEGHLVIVRRLRRIQLLSCLLFLLAGLLMLANESNFLGLDFLLYIKYVRNNWVMVLLIAAILQLYSTHRIANELEKEA